jgi:hypothetical protein
VGYGIRKNWSSAKNAGREETKERRKERGNYLRNQLRRFLLHLLLKGFLRICKFGFLANRRRATTLPLCFRLLGAAPQTEQEISSTKDASIFRRCPKCRGPTVDIETLTAAEI